MVKKAKRKNCIHTTTTVILQLISEGYHMPKEMIDTLNMSKQLLNYYLRNMINDGLLSTYANGTYDLTNLGKKRHMTYVTEESKTMIRLENMRFKFEIFEGFERFKKYVRNLKKTSLKNGVIQYHGQIQNLTIRLLFSSKNNPSLIITAEKREGNNVYKLYYEARQQVEQVLVGIVKDPKIKLGQTQHEMKPEWAIPHPFAKAILNGTQSSQIRGEGWVLNQSKGRNDDWEVDNIVQVDRIMNMPNDIELIKESLEYLTQQNIVHNKSSSNYSMYQ
jgi:predicted transcriptional regulator